jgi:hypothetical protein
MKFINQEDKKFSHDGVSVVEPTMEMIVLDKHIINPVSILRISLETNAMYIDVPYLYLKDRPRIQLNEKDLNKILDFFQISIEE